jgi:O-antigen/teichoic acid export membrane protein
LSHHSFVYFLVRFGNGIFALATLAIFTRLLSPAEYGVYALGIAIATLVSTMLFQWINVAVSRFYAIPLYDRCKVIDISARWFGAVTFAAAIFSLGALTFHEVFGMEPALIVILFLIAVALGQYNFALQVANAEGELGRYFLLSWAKSGAALLAGFVFIFFGLKHQGALLGFLVGHLFAVIAFAPKSLIKIKLSTLDAQLSTQMFRYSLPLTLTSISILIVDVADRFMIGNLLGSAHVAPYAVAYDLVQISVGPVMNVLFLAGYPLIVKVYESEGTESTRLHLQTLGNRLVGLGLPVAVGFSVLANEIAEIMFDNAYRQVASVIMPWLAAAIFAGAFKSYFLDVVFQLQHSTQYQGYIAILMAVINIFLNYLLLPYYGVVAAAWATFAAFLVGALASWHFGKSVFLLPDLGVTFRHSAMASFTMGFVLYSLPESAGILWFLVKIVLGLVTYAMIAWALDIASCRRLLKL